MFDIFMVVSDETGAGENWRRLTSIAPNARCVRNQKSIAAAYLACSFAAETDFFFVVDGDNFVEANFGFEIPFAISDSVVAVWRAYNPVNGLIYGHGGIKLFPTFAARARLSNSNVDVTSSSMPGYKVVEICASEHRFNTSPLEAWRTAFRECAKLAVGSTSRITRWQDNSRLEIWCDTSFDVPYANLVTAGAREGRAFGLSSAQAYEDIRQINNYGWLAQKFADTHGFGC